MKSPSFIQQKLAGQTHFLCKLCSTSCSGMSLYPVGNDQQSCLSCGKCCIEVIKIWSLLAGLIGFLFSLYMHSQAMTATLYWVCFCPALLNQDCHKVELDFTGNPPLPKGIQVCSAGTFLMPASSCGNLAWQESAHHCCIRHNKLYCSSSSLWHALLPTGAWLLRCEHLRWWWVWPLSATEDTRYLCCALNCLYTGFFPNQD